MDSLSTVKTNDNSFQSMSSAAVNAIDDVEISIFDAAKYFNEGLSDMMKRQVDEKKPSHLHHLLQPSLSSPAELGRKKSSTLSEASWSSQTALLITASQRWSAAKKWFLRRRRRNCCCSNGESIRVKEVIARPIVLMDTVKIKTSHADADADADAGDVVEIHRIRASEAPRQQRISATGRPFINAAVGFTFPILSSAAREDDVGSDASSDLFEIETFSSQTPSSCPIHCLCDSHAERKFAPASNVHRSRLSFSADESRPAAGCDGELEENVEEVGGGQGRRKSVDGAAEGPPFIPLPVGGRPVPAEKVRRGRSRSPPLVAAGG